MIEAKIAKHVPAEKPQLRIVRSGSGEDRLPGMDPIARESHIRMIRSLRRYYAAQGMGLIVDQATLGKGSLDYLSDDEILQLHRDMDRARECISDGIPFDEAGLIRSAPLREAIG